MIDFIANTYSRITMTVYGLVQSLAAQSRKSVKLITQGLPGVLKRLSVFFDVVKYSLLWLIEFVAFGVAGVLLFIGVLGFISGDLRTGVVALIACYLAIGLSLVISLATGELSFTNDNPKKE